jgi:hypothetical protein
LKEGKEVTYGLEIRPKVYDEYTGEEKPGVLFREAMFEGFFGAGFYHVNVVETTDDNKEVVKQRPSFSLYNVITSYTEDNGKKESKYPLYLKDPVKSK